MSDLETFPEGEFARIVERARAEYWTDEGMTDEAFVAGALAVLDVEGRVLPPGQSVAALRQQLDEARAEAAKMLHYASTLELMVSEAQHLQHAAEEQRDLAIAHDRQPYPTADAYEGVCRALEKHRTRADAAEADNARLLDVYRAAEAWAGVVRLVQAIDQPVGQPSRDVLAALDAYHAWTKAKPGDTPGELVPGEGEQQQPMWCGTDCIEPRHEPNWDQDFLDFPTAWWIQEQGFGHTDERCSAIQTNGALLCDCGAVEADWKRLRAEQRPAEAPDGGA